MQLLPFRNPELSEVRPTMTRWTATVTITALTTTTVRATSSQTPSTVRWLSSSHAQWRAAPAGQVELPGRARPSRLARRHSSRYKATPTSRHRRRPRRRETDDRDRQRSSRRNWRPSAVRRDSRTGKSSGHSRRERSRCQPGLNHCTYWTV